MNSESLRSKSESTKPVLHISLSFLVSDTKKDKLICSTGFVDSDLDRSDSLFITAYRVF